MSGAPKEDLLRGFCELSLEWRLTASAAYQAVWLWSAYASQLGRPPDAPPSEAETCVAVVLALKLRESDFINLDCFARRHGRAALRSLECALFGSALLKDASRTQYDHILAKALDCGLECWAALDYCAELALFDGPLREALRTPHDAAAAVVLAAWALQGHASSQLAPLNCSASTVEQALALVSAEHPLASELGRKHRLPRYDTALAAQRILSVRSRQAALEN